MSLRGTWHNSSNIFVWQLTVKSVSIICCTVMRASMIPTSVQPTDIRERPSPKSLTCFKNVHCQNCTQKQSALLWQDHEHEITIPCLSWLLYNFLLTVLDEMTNAHNLIQGGTAMNGSCHFVWRVEQSLLQYVLSTDCVSSTNLFHL